MRSSCGGVGFLRLVLGDAGGWPGEIVEVRIILRGGIGCVVYMDLVIFVIKAWRGLVIVCCAIGGEVVDVMWWMARCRGSLLETVNVNRLRNIWTNNYKPIRGNDYALPTTPSAIKYRCIVDLGQANVTV